jgi:predicted phage-related endonuclease
MDTNNNDINKIKTENTNNKEATMEGKEIVKSMGIEKVEQKLQKVITDFIEYKQMIADAEKFVKEYEERIKDFMIQNNIELIESPTFKLQLSQVKGSERIDTKLLKEEMPEIAKKYTKIGEPTWRLTIKRF